MKYIYYAHPLKHYNTPAEQAALEAIGRKFDLPIINPNGAIDQNQSGAAAMRQCLDLVRKASILVFTELENGWIGRGVHDEIAEAKKHRIPVYLLRDTGEFYRTFDIKVHGISWIRYASLFNIGRKRSIREVLGL